MIGLLGKKISTSYIYNSKGIYTPVTVVYIYSCYIFDILILNFYYFILSYSLIFYNRNLKKILKQFKVNYFDFLNFKIKNKIPLNIFYINQYINVLGASKGKGFSGVIKKHNFRSGRSSHGNSKAHNKPGSIGMCQDPGRVYPGKKMAGRLGGKKITLKNSKLLKIDFIYNIFYLKGFCPGFNNSNLLIFPKI